MALSSNEANRLFLTTLGVLAVATLAPSMGAIAPPAPCAGLQPLAITAEQRIPDGQTVTHSCKAVDLRALVVVGDGSVLEFVQSTLSIGTGGELVVNATGTLRFVGSQYDQLGIVLRPGGVLESFVIVNVNATGNSTTEAAAGASVWAWNAMGTLRQATTLGNDGKAVLVLPQERASGGNATQVHVPWRFAAVRTADGNTTVNHTSLTQVPPWGPTNVTLRLRDGPGPSAPSWPSAAAWNAPTHTNQTFARLSWAPAAIPGGSSWESVDHYVVEHTRPGAAPRTFTVGATGQPGADVSGLVQGNHSFSVRPVDILGRVGNASTAHSLGVDFEPPSAVVTVGGIAERRAGHYRSNVTLHIQAADSGGSGVARGEVCLRPGACVSQTNLTTLAQTTVSQEGTHNVSVLVHDRAGNQASYAVGSVVIDKAAPDLRFDVVPSPSGADGWSDRPLLVAVHATDVGPSGLDGLEYRIDDGAVEPYDAPLSFADEGEWTLEAAAVDAAGNVRQATRAVRIDLTPPQAPTAELRSLEDGRVQVNWAHGPPADLQSGLARAYVERVDAAGLLTDRSPLSLETSLQPIGPYPTGVNGFRVVVEDRAGNTAATDWVELSIERSVAGLLSRVDPLRARGEIPLAFTPTGSFEAVAVRFLVDGQEIASLDQTPFAITWDTTRHGDGTRWVSVVATDASGREQVEERAFELRNSYGAILADLAPAMVLAFGLLLMVGGLGALGLVLWGRRSA